jgi:hypothetical protein
MKKRIDRLTAVLIDAVLNNLARQSTMEAARALAGNNVPIEVALRVLTRPHERREYPVSPAALARQAWHRSWGAAGH